MNELEICNLPIHRKASENFIVLEDGLKLLGKTEKWFQALKICPNRYRRLRQNGFSGQTFMLVINQTEIEAICFSDWLALNAFMAVNSNRKAVEILQHYALKAFSKNRN